jgi:hypothetical protein
MKVVTSKISLNGLRRFKMKRLVFFLSLMFQSFFSVAQGWTLEFKEVASYIAECDVGALKDWHNKGGSLEIADADGYRPVYLAMLDEASLPCLEWLLEQGVDVNVQAKNGLTPILGAAFGYNVEAVDLLYKAGADPYIQDNVGNNIFYVALLIAKDDGESIYKEANKDRLISLAQEIYLKERDKRINEKP